MYQGAKLASGNDLTIDGGGAMTFEAVKDLHQESGASDRCCRCRIRCGNFRRSKYRLSAIHR
ncbi:hypothetical protein [Pseudomonas sp. NY15374]|uniref:hypothetical protein n=1 Tax=Pseudomonas sp. NY15374 TaxID=3400357 RepID=UPI003A88A59C